MGPSPRGRSLVTLAVLALGVSAAVAAPGRAARTLTALVITGRGVGHGVGLSQWGAEERARARQSYEQILGFYYPGARLGRVGNPSVRVLVLQAPQVRIESRASFAVQTRGGLLRLRAGSYAFRASGRLGGSALAFPLDVRPGAAPLAVDGRTYRGSIRLRRVGQRLEAINVLRLEDYLLGVVSIECPGFWRRAALEAQAVASRTYALANLRPRGPFDLYDDDRSQNYAGLARDLGAARAAVRATSGEALLYGGRPIQAYFSTANGGRTSGPEGVWGGRRLPYLVTRRDPFDARSPVASWGPVVVSVERLRRAFRSLPPHLVGIHVVRTDSERARAVVFSAADGSSYRIPGRAFQDALDLRSTYVSIRARFGARPATAGG